MIKKCFEGNLSSISGYSQLCVAYKNSYDFLFVGISKSNIPYDKLLEPLLFLMRHSIELALKFNIKYLSLVTKNDLEVNLIREHGLKVLSVEFKRLLALIKVAEFSIKEEINRKMPVVVKLSAFLHALDPGGTRFRYGASHISQVEASLNPINLTDLDRDFHLVFDFLILTPDTLDLYRSLEISFVEGELRKELKALDEN